MTTPWAQILRKVDDYRWEIPTSYKAGMRVPGLVYADEKMLRQITEEQALEQLANAATLPGIVGRALAMPDIHWGYGFPVGGVAAFDVNDGIISPGAIGYDVNCLLGNTMILHEFGYRRKIEDFDRRWLDAKIKCVNPHSEVRCTGILGFLKQTRPASQVFELTTETGRKIIATGDHPFLTPNGMIPLKDIPLGEFVSVYPFEGVPHEEVGDDVLLTEEDVQEIYSGHRNGLAQVLTILKTKNLLPLGLNHPKLPYLLRLMGFTQGDGSIQFLRSGGALLAFYAGPDDLEAIRRDIHAVGFSPSQVYRRHRTHVIDTHYGPRRFSRTEYTVHSGSAALAILLHGLGLPIGKKADQDLEAPGWLDRAPKWMKRLYLAGLFGAELTAPSTITDHPYNFYGPVLSMNKRTAYAGSGRRYLEKIQEWLRELGVESFILAEREERVGISNTATRLRLQVSSKPDNLIRLWTRVGFEYNRRKQYLGCISAQYLRLKSGVLEERELSLEFARAMHEMGHNAETIVAAVGSPHVSRGFVGPAIDGDRQKVRIGTSFLDFATFMKRRTEGLGETGEAWDSVVRKRPIPFDGPVYDFTVSDPNHNFIANSFVVSNCGVRLIRTNLEEAQVREKLEPLVDAMFASVPSGVGSTGRMKVGMGEIDTVLEGGARWAVGKGYGWHDDLEVTEAGGALPQADPDAVSPQAKQRGRGQVGTLGSGNHFLEVQVVDEIYDPKAATAMGLQSPGQVVVFVHCGSRGLGHQVCTDYLRTADRSAREHGITLVDRQLACMPFQSPEGRQYFGAMSAAANFAWANRQMITHWVREAFSSVFGQPPEALGMALVYDVAHNIGKIEEYDVDGAAQQVIVHRKGATRAFPAGHPEVPSRYRAVGQPVLIPGDMGRYSFIAVGTQAAMEESFGSTCHGAGRVMGRKQAVRTLAGVDVGAELRRKGIVVRAQDRSLLAEEAPQAYKDVADVVAVCDGAGISRRVARTKPIGVVKG